MGDVIELTGVDFTAISCADGDCTDLRILSGEDGLDLNRMIDYALHGDGLGADSSVTIWVKLDKDYAATEHTFYAYTNNAAAGYPPIIMERANGWEADTDPISGIDWDEDVVACNDSGGVTYQSITSKFNNAHKTVTDGESGTECRTHHANTMFDADKDAMGWLDGSMM